MKRLPNPAWNGAIYYGLFWIAFATFIPFLNIYYAHIGLSNFQISVLAALTPLMTLLCGPWLSMLADNRRWRRPMLLGGLCGVALIVFLVQFYHAYFVLLILGALWAIFHSPVHALGNGMISRMASRYSVDYGRLRVWGSLGFAVTSTLCGALWQLFGYQSMFTLGALSFIPLIFAAPRLEEGPSEHQQTQFPLKLLWRDGALIALLVSAFLAGISEGMYVTFSGVYVDSLGGGQFLIGALFGFSAFAEIPTMQFSGLVFKKINKPVMLALSYGLMGLAFGGYALVRVPWPLLLCSIFKGVGYGFSFVGLISLINERTPKRWSATVHSFVIALGWGLAQLLTVPLGGWLADLFGLRSVFLVATLTNLLAMGVVFLAYGHRAFEKSPLMD